MTSIAQKFYLLGYGGALLPRTLRKLLARTDWHRGWLAGAMGIYGDHQLRNGVCDREWRTWRKGNKARQAISVKQLLIGILHP